MPTAVLLVVLAASGGDAAVRRVALRAPAPGRLGARVDAQLVDVPGWRRLPTLAAPGPATLDDDLALAAALGVDAIVCVAPSDDPSGLRVTLTHAAAQRRYARTVAALDATGQGAATQSAVAALLRDSLRALSDAGALAWPVEAARPARVWSVGALAAAWDDGLGVAPALGLRGRLEGPGLTLTLAGAVGFSTPRRLDGVGIELTRHLVTASAGYGGALGRWSLEGGGRIGAAVYRRRTVEAASGAPRAPRTTVALALGPYGEAAVRLGAARVFVRATVDGLVGAPELRVAGPGGEAVVGAARAVAFGGQLGASVTWR